jgi:hypothetical protein
MFSSVSNAVYNISVFVTKLGNKFWIWLILFNLKTATNQSTFHNAENQDTQNNNFGIVVNECEMWSLTFREQYQLSS